MKTGIDNVGHGPTYMIFIGRAMRANLDSWRLIL